MKLSYRTTARFTAAIMLLAAFVAGAASALVYVHVKSQKNPGTMVTVQMRRELPEELKRLNLTNAQRSRVLAILDATRARSVGLLKDFEPRLQLLLDSADAQVQSELTAEQRTRLAADRARRPRMIIDRETSINGHKSKVTDSVSR
jgi:hypothetical protein